MPRTMRRAAVFRGELTQVIVNFVPEIKIFVVFEPRPELALKLILNFCQSDSRCSCRVILIEKNLFIISFWL